MITSHDPFSILVALIISLKQLKLSSHTQVGHTLNC